MANIFTRAWAAVESFVSTDIKPEAQMVMVKLTTAEHALLQRFHPLFNQILDTIGTQGLQIVDDAVGDLATGALATAAAGGNIGAGVAAAASAALNQIETQVATDAKQDAKNAVYGVIAAAQAALGTTPAPALSAPPAQSGT
jgi:hypothetical protein